MSYAMRTFYNSSLSSKESVVSIAILAPFNTSIGTLSEFFAAIIMGDICVLGVIFECISVDAL